MCVFVRYLLSCSPYCEGAENVRRQMHQLRSTHLELQRERLTRDGDETEARANAAAEQLVDEVTAEWNVKINEVRMTDEAARARLAARHEQELRRVNADLAAQMANVRPGPADVKTRRLRLQHREATERVRRGLQVVTQLAPGAGIDVSGLVDPESIESRDTSHAVKVILERSAEVLKGGGGGGGGDGGGAILPSVMNAVTNVADVQELKAELSGMIHTEAAERLQSARRQAHHAANKYIDDLVRKQRTQAEVMERQHRSNLKAVERQANAAVERARLEGARRVTAVRRKHETRVENLTALHKNAQDVRESKRRAARESLIPFNPTGRDL